MKPAIALALFGSTMLLNGCALIHDGSRNLCHSLCTPIETHRENSRNRRWAEDAWREISGGGGPCKQTDDYAQGFKEGYAEYLYRGGDGEPPLTAPVRYRHIRYQSPLGYLAIEDWRAGYRHGAGVARDSGARQFIIGPFGLRGEGHADVNWVAPPVMPDQPKDEPPLVLIAPPHFLPLRPVEELVKEPPPKSPFGPLRFDTPTIESDPPIAKPVEPVRVKITNVSEAPEPVRAKIMKVIESNDNAPTPTKARILGISVPEPVRARITTITVAPKE